MTLKNVTAHEHDEARRRKIESALKVVMSRQTEGGQTSRFPSGRRHQPIFSETTMIVELVSENVDGSVVVVIQVYNLVAEINGRIL